MRVVGSVHNDTADTWTNTFTAVTSGRTDLDVLVLDVSNHTDRGGRFKSESAYFAGRHTYLGVIAFFGHKLRLSTGTSYHLRALTRVDFDGVDLGTNRNL